MKLIKSNFGLSVFPPGIPRERAEILREAMRKTFKDPEFHKEYKKITGDDPSPLTSDALEKIIRELPRDSETVEFFKKFAGPGPLPQR
ncbi:MAG: hypothetical protein ACREQA_02150 [Candidatus Binatia bacterium]